jgi:transcriptional regulator with XRE-family HTH domain/DNA-directed RNA polymerase specialized sigma24 family protein
VKPVDALLQFRAGQLSREALASTVYPLLWRLAKVTAWKVGGVDANDLAQELWLIFEKSVLVNYEPGVALEPYLLVIARNAAFQMRSKVREIAVSDLIPELPSDLGDRAPEQDDRRTPIAPDDSVLIDMDRRIGILEIRRRLYNAAMSESDKGLKQAMQTMLMPCVKESATVSTEKASLPVIQKKPPTQRVLSPDNQALVDYRMDLDMTQAEFADALGIGMPRLSSYEYGRATIPDWVMKSARDLAGNNGNALGAAHQKFDNVSMPEILAGWAKELGVPYDNSLELATLLGASKPTVTRWKNELIRPRLSALLRYEHMVKEAKKKLARQSEFVEQLATSKKKRK